MCLCVEKKIGFIGDGIGMYYLHFSQETQSVGSVAVSRTNPNVGIEMRRGTNHFVANERSD